MHKRGTIIKIMFDSTTSAVVLDKNGKVIYLSKILKSKHHEIEIPRQVFDNFMSTFTTFESQKEGKMVLSRDFDKLLDNKIKENNTKPPVGKNTLSPYEIQHNQSSSTLSSSEEEESVEEITK